MEELRILSTVELIELLRADRKNKGLPYGNHSVGKAIGITQNSLKHLLFAGGTMSDETAYLMAEQLKLPFSYVLICMQYERTKTEEGKQAMREVIDRYMNASALVLVLLAVFYPVSALLHAV